MTSNMGSEKILENFEDLEAVGEEHRQEYYVEYYPRGNI